MGLKSLPIPSRQRPRAPITDATGESLHTKDYYQRGPTATISSDRLLGKISLQMYTAKLLLTILTKVEVLILCVRGSFPELRYINTQFYNFLPILLQCELS